MIFFQDTNLCGYHIPAGTMFVPLQWAVHMDGVAWPQPEQFQPQRFLNEVGEFTVPTNFIPFQTGKRLYLCRAGPLAARDPLSPSPSVNHLSICTYSHIYSRIFCSYIFSRLVYILARTHHRAGKRMCLGEELAKMLLFAYCGSIVAHFRWTSCGSGVPSMQGDCGITLTPPRCAMVFEKR